MTPEEPTSRALDGVLVVDLTTGIDGPFSTKLLADLGARVIKVEPLDGDPTRRLGPFPTDGPDPERSAHFLYLNANKESVTLDLGQPSGQAVIRALAARADILVENFAPGVMADYGLGYPELEAVNPRLVVTSITPFGQYGPYAQWKGPDIVRQAVGGWMVQGGRPDREPLKSGANLSLYITGTCAAGATLMAYYYAQESGQGQHVDVSAMEVVITCSGQEAYRVSQGGPEAAWKRTGHTGLPFTILPCRDGWVGVNLLFARDWKGFCEWAGMEDLLSNPEYDELAKLRVPGRTEVLNERLIAWTMQHDRDWLMYEGQKRRLAIVSIPDMASTLTLSQHVARGYLREVEHPLVGRYTQPGAPFIMSDTPWDLVSPAPTLGSSNPVLDELLDDELTSEKRGSRV
jgi:crotonobetainyl-CoA:carnitine CoA-transferase CaiB-like acyl-CoA transferase